MSKERARKAFEELCKEAGFGEDDTKLALEKFADNEKFAEKFTAGFTRHSEYSSALDKLKNLETEMGRNKEWFTNSWPVVQKSLEEAGYVLVNGQLIKSNKQPNNDEGINVEGLTQKQVEEMMEGKLTHLRNAFASTMKDGLRLASRHAAQFKEELDVDALEKIALEKQIPLQTAYDLYVAPRVEDARKKSEEERLKQGIEEGVKDRLSKMNLPVDLSSASSTPSHGFAFATGTEKTKLTDADLANMWNEVQGAKA